MPTLRVRRASRQDSREFLKMLHVFAEFERLEAPSTSGERRLLSAVFDEKKLNLLVGVDGKKIVGYALYFFTYSSFLAKPSLYLEDIFVLDGYRKMGLGVALFRRCAQEAVRRKCGRMEWSVLDWNNKAIRFYEGLGAKEVSELKFRLDEGGLEKVSRQTP